MRTPGSAPAPVRVTRVRGPVVIVVDERGGVCARTATRWERIRARLQARRLDEELAQGTPVHVYLAPDALRVLSGGTPAADLNEPAAEPDVMRQAS